MDFHIPAFDGPIPWLRQTEMVEVDRLMVDELGISVRHMMEHAGRHLAVLAKTRFLGRLEGRSVRVLAGAGGNGGGALVAARRLACWGAHVTVVLTSEERRFRPTTATELAICRRLDMPITTELPTSPDAGDDLLIDGMVGYSLIGPLRGTAEKAARWANTSVSPILSLDLPSGLDPDRGPVGGVAVTATATLTLAAPKRGLKHPDAARFAGDLFIADIGVPPSLYDSPTLERLNGFGPRFEAGDLLSLPHGPVTHH